MTIITVTTVDGLTNEVQRSELARRLTDAVCEIECGKISDQGRSGFQVHLPTLAPDSIAIGGVLAPLRPDIDIIHLDITVMDGHWPDQLREQIPRTCLAIVADVLGQPKPRSTWWSTFRIVPEGSFGAGGNTISILDLLATGAFTPERSTAIRDAMSADA